MFELETAISNWRRQMARGGINSPGVLAELEAHLREDIERLIQAGCGPEQAFSQALKNLGNAALLRKEFNKCCFNSSLIEKLMLAVSGVLFGLILFLSAVTILLSYLNWGERLVAFAGVGSILLVARGFSVIVRFLPAIHDARRRWAAGLSCILAGFVASNLFCTIVLPHFQSSADSNLPAIGVWAVFLLAVFTCAGVGLLLSQPQREARGMIRSNPGTFWLPAK